jgi:acyl-coenzyme A synthetase/AMP-(fatty) acid ligase
VQPADINEAGPALEAELIGFCRAHLSAIKCPRTIDFDGELPRHPTGELYKRLIRIATGSDTRSESPSKRPVKARIGAKDRAVMACCRR